MEPGVVDAHIGLYVNEFTADLGNEGYAAVNALLGRAAAASLTPAVPELLPR
jgi:1,4-dihydroxy-6-naphthoate synthase